MNITFTLNGKKISRQIEADTLLIDLVRDLGCYSVKRGCETSNCGLCTVFMDDQPILSCSILAARVDGHKIDTLEGLQEEAAEFGAFIANQGAEQCGFCNRVCWQGGWYSTEAACRQCIRCPEKQQLISGHFYLLRLYERKLLYRAFAAEAFPEVPLR